MNYCACRPLVSFAAIQFVGQNCYYVQQGEFYAEDEYRNAAFRVPGQPEAPDCHRHRAAVGLLGGQNGRIGGRVQRDLVAAAKEKSGITSDTELLEYALAKVALEDDFGAKLICRKGRNPKDLDLEF